jgi:sugar lactone lactonase YvrE
MRTALQSIITTAGAALLLGFLVAPVRADILYVGDNALFTIQKFASNGTSSFFASDTGVPQGIAFDAVGNLYEANQSGTVFKYTNGVRSVFASGGLLGISSGIAFDAVGNLYVTNVSNNTIVKFTSDGLGSVFASGLNGPSGLAFDSAGNLYVANFFDNAILKFTLGGVRTVFASSGLNGPLGLAFDRAGNLYASNASNHTIEKFTLNGIGSVFAQSGLNFPVGLAFDGAGNLYASNADNHTIEKFSPTGTDLGVFASEALYSPGWLAFTDNSGVPLKLPPNGAIPEPATLALLGLGLPALLCRSSPRRVL